jgi:glutamate-1-semialdehyde 2,1-aminomutase
LAGRVAASSAGIPEGTLAHTVVAPLDDEAAFDRAIEAAAGDLAAVIVEPVPANYGLLPQRREWIAYIEAKCRAAGALLIFDEVITGFRVGATGAAGLFGIRPDLICYGKVIGGGFPVGAYGGRRDLMDLVAPAGPVYQAGTLSANPVGMRAGLATLEYMRDVDGWTVLEWRADAFTKRLQADLRALDPQLEVVRFSSMFWIRRRAPGDVRRPDAIPVDQADWYARFFHAALERGIYLPPSAYEVCFLSIAHDDALLETARAALVEAAAAIQHA